MPLAVQVANPGSRGQDSRYKFDPTFMTDLGNGIVTDGVWHYQISENGGDSMLSLDRPSVAVPGVPPADDTDSVMRYSASVPRGATHPGSGPATPVAPPPRQFVGMPKLRVGEAQPLPMVDVGPASWSDPNYGAQNKQQFQKGLESLYDIIQKNNPGLYKDRAAFQGDVNAIMAGNPNIAKQPYRPPQVPASSPQPGNPYGTLGPSPQRVQNVVKAAQSTAPGQARLLTPAPVPVRAAPKPVKPIIAPKKVVSRGGR